MATDKDQTAEAKNLQRAEALRKRALLAGAKLTKNPNDFLHALDALGQDLRKDLKRRHNIKKSTSSNKEVFILPYPKDTSPSQRKLVFTYPDLARDLAKTSNTQANEIKLDKKAERAYYVFKLLWKDEEQTNEGQKHNSNINDSNRDNIALAMAYLEAITDFDEKRARKFDPKSDKEKNEAAQLFYKSRQAIQQFEVARQSFFRYIGYVFGTIFAFSQGGGNGVSMSQAIVGFAALCGATGLAIGAPYIAIPAAIIGLGSFVINYAIAKPATGRTFIDFFGRDKFLGGLFTYYDKDGNKIEFTLKQKLGYLVGGALPALTASICIAVLSGFCLQSMLAGVAFLAPVAAPIAYISMIGCGIALFAVYGKDMTTLFHFPKNVKGMEAVKSYFKGFFPVAMIRSTVEKRANEYRERLLAKKDALKLSDNDIEKMVADYKKRTTTIATVSSAILAVAAVAGIGITLLGAAIAVPAMFPAIPLVAALIMAGIALWGQVPFYSISASKVATRFTMFLSKPKAVKELEKLEKAEKLATEQEAGIKTENELDFEKTYQASEKARYKKMSPLSRANYDFNKTVDTAGEVTTKTSQVLNPLGNGALAAFSFVARNIFVAIGAFFFGTTASGAIGLAIDDSNDANLKTNRDFAKLFKGSDKATGKAKTDAQTGTSLTEASTKSDSANKTDKRTNEASDGSHKADDAEPTKTSNSRYGSFRSCGEEAAASDHGASSLPTPVSVGVM